MNIFNRFLVLICKGFFCLINKLFPPRARAVKRLAEIERYPKEALRQLEEEAPVEMRPGILAGTEGLIRLTKTVEVELGISRDKEREELNIRNTRIYNSSRLQARQGRSGGKDPFGRLRPCRQGGGAELFIYLLSMV